MSRYALKAPGRFWIVSSYDQWSSREAMTWDGCAYRYRGRLVAPGLSFQIRRGGSREDAVYPSVNNAAPGVAHVLKGPDQKGNGLNWLVVSKAGEFGEIEIVLSCPKGFMLSLTWLRDGKPWIDPGQDLDVATVSDREGQLKLFQKTFGQWGLRREIGRGKQRGAVFFAEGRGGRPAAVKFPVCVRELQHLSALQGVPGVPELLDYGNGPRGGLFQAMPVLGDSLESLLYSREDCGMGGRMSWAAAQALGKSLLTTLQGMHARGVMHCDLGPLNVLVGPRCHPFLIDFGQSRPVGSAHFDRGEGTVEYNSIRAGFPGQRTPVDDLESLGWLMWRCVVGPLPWHDLPKEVDWSDRQARQGVYEQVSRLKERLLDSGFDALGDRWGYCPEDLKAYLLRTRQEASMDRLEVPNVFYTELGSLLHHVDADQHWADVATNKPRTVYEARLDKLVWRPLEAAGLLGAEVSLLPECMQVAATGSMEVCDGGLWAKLDPVWLPGLPPTLCQRGGWVLVADWVGQLLWQVSDKGAYLSRERVVASAEAEDEEEDKCLRTAAAEAAHLSSRSRKLLEPAAP
mmetsp:Transcript_47947/g.138777  ORF Transcript_47947/g.138777 Transcript_47947/m.138777 type:complete len:571 (-) Transcript_47947:51-1763(-)